MRKLLVLIVGLLLVSPAWALSQRGTVDHMITTDLPTCNAGTEGYRAYDTTLNENVICDGGTYIASGPTTYGEPTIEDGTPTISFDDNTAITGVAGTVDAEIIVNCLTAGDCGMSLGIDAGTIAVYPITMVGVAVNDFDTRIGNAGGGANYINVDQAGAMTAVGTGSIDATSAHETVFFCGELGANTDEFFAGPNLVSVFTGAVPTDHTFASGTCDALGDTAVAAVENDIDEFQGYRVNGMFCQVSAAPGGADTVVTFVDDTANTAVTCTIAAAETSCASARGLWADVAADSQVAVGSLNGTDDENAEDIHCNVYLTWAG